MGTGWFLTTDGDLVGMVPDRSDQQSTVLETVAGITAAVRSREHPRSDIHEQSKVTGRIHPFTPRAPLPPALRVMGPATGP